jgi:hypothetical protein
MKINFNWGWVVAISSILLVSYLVWVLWLKNPKPPAGCSNCSVNADCSNCSIGTVCNKVTKRCYSGPDPDPDNPNIGLCNALNSFQMRTR